MKIQVKKLHPNAVVPFKKEGRASDFCYDMTAAWVEKTGFLTYKYHTGIALQVVTNRDDEKTIIGINGRSRSSITSTGMIMTNGQGTIDKRYSGEICFEFYHIFPWRKKYAVGDRIAQVTLEFSAPMEFEEVNEFTTNTRGRGDNGWGSSGRKG